MRIGRDIAFFILGGVLAIVAQGLSTELQAEVGQCRFSTGLADTFYNSDLHTDSYLRPACASVGLAGKWRDSERFGWRVALLGTGSIQARDNVATNDERAHAHVACKPPSEDGCMVRFNGSGETFGVSLSITAEQPIARHLSAIGEFGLFFFQHHFKAEARFMDCHSCGRQISYNETSRLWDEPSPMVGLTLRYRSVYIAARHYWPAEHRPLSLTNYAFNQFSIGVAKEFK